MRTSYLSHLECSFCGNTMDAGKLQTVCPTCEKPLLARYDFPRLERGQWHQRGSGWDSCLWRYSDVLPVSDPWSIVSLGEGATPLLRAIHLGEKYEMPNLLIKDESLNPTGSFKARGLCLAVSRARELGVKELVIPSAGNAAGAMSSYAAKAGLVAHIFMPHDVPEPFRMECAAYGAHVTLIEGLITDCGKKAREMAQERGWFDLSTLKEPYRIEGKKTMGYEIAEEMGWELPDVIIYPAGGGTGLIGMWKAFDEMESLGWINETRPRMVVVQAEGCAPIVRAFENDEEFAVPWEDAETIAAGIRVPAAIGDFLMLQAVRESHGTAIAVSDAQLLAGQRAIAESEGILSCPEGGATLAALEKLLATGWIERDRKVVLFNTGTGMKYPESWSSNEGSP